MASTRNLGLMIWLFLFAWLIMGSCVLRESPMVEAARILKREQILITTRAGFIFESKPKGSGPGSGPSNCHHGPGGGNGVCPPT
ncbi:hypothetical protein KFK09_013419 [Dendrobium nobile]|uniref:Uncharacterized protein n=1 Tax=Dendrobium nobile TaxID=94219 RepID=A0A8T3B7D6_DENNO|nr:hypothetical protein KFK09_013419 [Dendrobium nobile]